MIQDLRDTIEHNLKKANLIVKRLYEDLLVYDNDTYICAIYFYKSKLLITPYHIYIDYSDLDIDSIIKKIKNFMYK